MDQTCRSYSSPRASASASVMTSPIYRQINIPFGIGRHVLTPNSSVSPPSKRGIVPHPFLWVLNISNGILLPLCTTRLGHVRPHPHLLLHSTIAVPGG